MNGLTAEGVLIGDDIVHFERHDKVGAGSLEQTRYVTGRNGVA
jgi:hypothetical protein